MVMSQTFPVYSVLLGIYIETTCNKEGSIPARVNM